MSEMNDTPSIIEIPLTKGYVAFVGTADGDLAQHKWCSLIQPTGNVYAKRGESRKIVKHHHSVLIHRVIMERILGRVLEKAERVDHKNGDTLDNARSNLRLATHAQNMRNSKRRKNNTSGYKGVNFYRGRWRAQIQHNNRGITIGMFDTPEEAYCAKALELQGEFARYA